MVHEGVSVNGIFFGTADEFDLGADLVGHGENDGVHDGRVEGDVGVIGFLNDDGLGVEVGEMECAYVHG